MYDNETKNQFIELRADGLSLAAISARLNVPRPTLGRWHHEFIAQIQRLRSLQWHLLEEQIGHRLEDSLHRIAQRIRKWEDELDKRDPHCRTSLELVRIIRDSRREYLQLRALLLAPLQPTRARPACLTSLDPHQRDKMRQNPDTLDTTSLPPNDLQPPEPSTSHSVSPVTPDVTSELTSPPVFVNATGQPLNAHDSASSQSEISNLKSEIVDLDHHAPPSPPVTGSIDTQPPINTPLQRGEPGAPTAAPTPSPVSTGPSVVASPDIVPADVAASVSPASEPGVPPGDTPKKHKPYWLHGYYYENPEYPEHIARAMCARAAGSQPKTLNRLQSCCPSANAGKLKKNSHI